MKITANRRTIEKNLVGYLCILPAFIVMVIFLIYPSGALFYYSVTDMNFFAHTMSFIGLDNFASILSNNTFLQALWNSIYFALIVVPVQSFLAFLIAVFLTKINTKISSFFRTIYFFPVVATLVAIAQVWVLIYQPDFGLANSIMHELGLPRQGFLGDVAHAFHYIMLFSIWKSFGWYVIVFLAGIMGISKDIYEAGKIDGVTPVKELFYITLPLIRRTTLLVIIMTTMDSVKVFAPVYIMTNGSGGPLNSTNVAINYIYNTAFSFGDLGYAAAGSVLVFVIIMAISALQYFFLNKND